MAKRSTKKTGKFSKARSSGRQSAPATTGKHLVIVESPAKARTINKYLGKDYVVMASVGHVRDLPSRNPKGVKNPVPGVDLEHDFQPTYEVMSDKKKTVSQLKKAAKDAADVWFATDLDREGEAISWHLSEALGISDHTAKRVVFNAITKDEIKRAFDHPRPIDKHRVDAQQARRILDRIVGYQVSPLLWKKVAGGLSAGRVQSVAVRIIVDREREILSFIPEEYWKITGYFTADVPQVAILADAWRKFLDEAPEQLPNGRKLSGRTVKDKNAWLSEHNGLLTELVEVGGKKFDATNVDQTLKIAQLAGFKLDERIETEDPNGKGPAAMRINLLGSVDATAGGWAIKSIETKRTNSRPGAPFITSTLQQSAANVLGFAAQTTMRTAQQLYEGVELGNLGSVGLITYMRTDSTHLSPEAIGMARNFIQSKYGEQYLPAKPNFYASSNKAAQEAHEAIRPTDVTLHPDDPMVKKSLDDRQYKLYRLIWQRFVGSQMTPAQWDSTTVLITNPNQSADKQLVFKGSGRVLVFDGFYKVTGVPRAGDEATLPRLAEKQPMAPLQVEPTQHFTSPPPRYTEASLVKKLESEGIGRPSTYASIIQVIQNRKYVEQTERRFFATDLGMVVTDKLIEGFPSLIDIGYTREMEEELDKIEEEHVDWVTMLRQFYGPFKKNLERAHEEMSHAKAETQPAPFECPDCGGDTMYRFGKNGKFLSCSRYPDCKYAAPIDRNGKPIGTQMTDILCPICGEGMTRRVGRFGPFLGCENYPECKGIVNLDPKKGTVKLPKAPPMATDVPCPKCEDGTMNLRRSKRGPWMSCAKFPKCRGRVGWKSLEEAKQTELEKALNKWESANPVPTVRNTDGQILSEGYVPRVMDGDSISDGGQPADEQLDSDAA